MAGAPRRRGPAPRSSLWRILRRAARRRKPGVRLRGPPLSTTAPGATPLVGPPAALPVHVSARVLTEVGRADDEDLEALWPSFVSSPRAGRHTHRVPLFELDDLVV